MSYPWSKTVAGFPLPGVVVFKVYLFIRSFFGFQLPGDAFFMQNTRYLKPPSEKQIKKSDMLQKKELCFSWSEEGGHRASFFPLASGNTVWRSLTYSWDSKGLTWYSRMHYPGPNMHLLLGFQLSPKGICFSSLVSTQLELSPHFFFFNQNFLFFLKPPFKKYLFSFGCAGSPLLCVGFL